MPRRTRYKAFPHRNPRKSFLNIVTLLDEKNFSSHGLFAIGIVGSELAVQCPRKGEKKMVHADLLKAVVDTLDSHRYLSHEDFILAEYKNHEKEPCLSIKYRYQSNLFFKFSFLTKEPRRPQHEGIEAYRFGCTIRPGREAVEEELSVEERSGLIQELQDWLPRLYHAIVSAPRTP